MTAEKTIVSGKVGTFPGKVFDVQVESGTSVAAVLDAAEVTFGDGQVLKFNGIKFKSAAALADVDVEGDGFQIMITGKVKGNA